MDRPVEHPAMSEPTRRLGSIPASPQTRWRVSVSHCGSMRRIESLRMAALLFIAAVVLGIR